MCIPSIWLCPEGESSFAFYERESDMFLEELETIGRCARHEKCRLRERGIETGRIEAMRG